MQSFTTHDNSVRSQVFLFYIRTFFRCFKLTVLFSMASFMLFSIIMMNEPFQQIPLIILRGLGLSVFVAFLVSLRYKTSTYDITTANGTAFLNLVKKIAKSYNFEIVHETSEILIIKSAVNNFFATKNYEIEIHSNVNNFQLIGYNFQIKKILKKIPDGFIIHVSRNSSFA